MKQLLRLAKFFMIVLTMALVLAFFMTHSKTFDAWIENAMSVKPAPSCVP